MKRMNHLLLSSHEKKIINIPESQEILLPLWDFDIKENDLKIEEGTRVVTGELIVPGVYSTVTGTVKAIESMITTEKTVAALKIEVSEEEEIDPAVTVEPDFLEKDPVEILKKLNRANLGFYEEFVSIQTVIISAVDSDPLTSVSQQILREKKELITEGIKLITYLTGAEKIIVAVPENLFEYMADIKNEQVEIFGVHPVYPNGLPEILVRDISNQTPLGKHVFLKVEKLVASVIAIKEGKPFVHKVVSVTDKNGAENFRVRIGTPIKELLKENNIGDNDKVIIGGPLRGYTCLNMDIPVTESMDCIYVQDRSEVIHNANRQCVNCGNCVRICPVNIDVNLISRFSEFSIFDRCQELGVLNCIECGLCAYYCTAGRSLVQFMSFAKKEIEKMEGEEDK